VASYAYAFDLANRVTSENLDNGTRTTYAYDVTNQLTTVTTSAGSTTYGYDFTGNRTNTGYVTGPENQLTADSTYSYVYDQEGNLITKTNKSIGFGAGDANLYRYVINHPTNAVDSYGLAGFNPRKVWNKLSAAQQQKWTRLAADGWRLVTDGDGQRVTGIRGEFQTDECISVEVRHKDFVGLLKKGSDVQWSDD